MTENESPIDDRVRELLATKIGFLPEEIDARQRFLKTSRNILNFYSNEYGLHLEPEQQAKISQLVHSCDLLVLKTSKLEFYANSMEMQAYKAALQKKPFNPNPRTTKELQLQLEQTQTELIELNSQTAKLVQQFHDPKD